MYKKLKTEKVHEASGEFLRHGFSYNEKRWSYGEAPPGASKLRPFLEKLDAHSDLEKCCNLVD